MANNLERGAGVLLHISSLPSPYGIGTMGKAAYEFVDNLKAAGQKYWQVLPVGQTGFGDSPYQSFSAFAGNPFFVDIENLINDGLIDRKDADGILWGRYAEYVEYDKVYDGRQKLLSIAYDNWKNRREPEYEEFVRKNSYWLDDYALYMSCREHFNNQSWLHWDDDIKNKKPEAVIKYSELLKDKISYWKFIQFRFYTEWDKLKKYANNEGIKIIGDIPIYVSLDSSDVWSNPELFQLDEKLEPKAIAGCPPDAFAAEGQRWGNPLYAWDVMEKDDFAWWKKRIKASATLYDVIRIDHFIGIVRYFSIPVELPTKDGHYEAGPGEKLTNAIDSVLGDAKIIAEDLGVKYEPVQELLDKTGYPGMKVMMFGFDGNPNNEHLPHQASKNSIMYIGTHDNETLKGFIDNQPENVVERIKEYISAADDKSICTQMIKSAYLSVSNVCIIQMQDILEKNNFARMNFPSTIGDNWKWRLQQGEFSAKKIMMLKKLVDISGR